MNITEKSNNAHRNHATHLRPMQNTCTKRNTIAPLGGCSETPPLTPTPLGAKRGGATPKRSKGVQSVANATLALLCEVHGAKRVRALVQRKRFERPRAKPPAVAGIFTEWSESPPAVQFGSNKNKTSKRILGLLSKLRFEPNNASG